jgi:N-acetylglucosaminyl-diphospho-decaprenol L-rhamnosyltransferase
MPSQNHTTVRAAVTVSVVSHRQTDLVAQLLSDLKLHCGESVAKVVVTHNTPDPLISNPPDCPFPIVTVRNAIALGFGANHNQAFEQCDSDWFLVINPDVRVRSNVIAELLQRAKPSTGMLAPQELDESCHLVQNLRGVITPWEVIQRKILKRSPHRPINGGWVKGMFMLIPSQVFRSIQGFDERYFMYCEDFDLCARIITTGRTVDHYSDLKVIHAWQRDSHKSPIIFFHHIKSLCLMWTSKVFWNYYKFYHLKNL